MVAWIWSGEPPPWLGAALVVQGLVGWWFRAGVREVSEQVERRAQELGVLRDLLALIENEPATTPRLKELAAELTATGSVPSVEIGRLVRLADLLDSRQNQFFVPIAALLLLGTQTAVAIDHWRARCGSRVPRWLEIAGEYEALAALAGFAAEHPADHFPTIDDGRPRFDADDLAHPLIPVGRAVPNSVRLGGEGPHVLLVSGSNMSGKSTWLRTIGINAVLAQAGAPVRARALRMSALEVGATLRIQDSLQAGQSRFFAEITRLSQIVSMARRRATETDAPAVLFLLDEVLAGTNSHDRRIGAEGIVKGLVGARRHRPRHHPRSGAHRGRRRARAGCRERALRGSLRGWQPALRLSAARGRGAHQQRAGADAIGGPGRGGGVRLRFEPALPHEGLGTSPGAFHRLLAPTAGSCRALPSAVACIPAVPPSAHRSAP